MKKLLLSFVALFNATHINAQACTGVPAANTVIASSTSICVGNTVTLTLQNPYTATGIFYQWASSTTSSLGPWAQISGANNSSFVSNAITQSGWYTAVIACSNSFMTATATPVYINVGTTGQTSTIPYYENFSVGINNNLPNCSWTANALGSTCQTFINSPLFSTNNAVAAFVYQPATAGTFDYFTMGLQLQAGLTYSAGIWAAVSSTTATNWTNFGMAISSTQSAANATVFTSTGVPPSATAFSPRSGTFTVPSTGTYYIRIFATEVVSANFAQYILLDDLSVTVPCNQGQNGASAMVSPPSGTICAGDSLLVNFTPAANCTMTGLGNSVYVKSNTSSAFTFTATNVLSGCSSTLLFPLIVNPSPTPFVMAATPSICPGGTTQVSSFNNQTLTLNPGSLTGTSFTVSPATTTIYTLTLASTTNVCAGASTLQITVSTTPTLSFLPATLSVCKGEVVTIQGNGAATYEYNNIVTGSLIVLPIANTSSVYTITGSSTLGCKSTAQYSLTVEECLGFETLEQDLQVNVFPNPTKDKIFVQCDNALQLSVITVDGKLVFSEDADASSTAIDLSKLDAGIYFLQVQSTTQTKTLRVLKE